MSTSEPVQSIVSSPTTLVVEGERLTPKRPDQAGGHGPPASVELRGTRPNQFRPGRSAAGLRGKVRTPQPRKDGASAYLKQLVLTTLPLIATDLIVLVAAVLLSSVVGLEWLNPDDPTSRAIVWIPSVALAWVLINAVLGLYPGVGLGLVDEIRRLSMSLTVVAIITMARQNIYREFWLDRLAFLVVTYCLCLFLAPTVRSIVRKALARTSWWGFPTLVCGDDAVAFGVDQWLLENRRLGLRPLGVIANPAVLELEHGAPRYLGAWTEARRIAEDKHAFWAVLVEPEQSEHMDLGMTSAVEQHLGNVPLVFVVSKLTGIPDGWNRHQMDEGLPGLLVEQHLLLPIPQLVKRGMDLAIATVAGILLMPLFVIVAALIKLTSPGPVFYGHERVGRDNSRFKAWKFRTMVQGAEAALEAHLNKHPELLDEWHRDHKLKNDPRVTPLGRWMRKWSVDELPQLWNVLVGEMSAVGPRPIVPNEIEKYGDHFEIFCSVLPGMTGLWQVCGRNNTSFQERIQLGVYYIHHWSPWLDAYLLVRTVKTVLFTKGAY